MAKAVGITEFLTDDVRLGGVLKQSPSDFIVKEVCLSKSISLLTEEVFIHSEAPAEPSELSESSIKSLELSVGPDLTSQLIRLTQEILAGSKESILEIPCPDDKQQRTMIHQAIKTHAPILTSSTELSTKTIKIYSSKLAQSFNKRQKLGLDSRGAKKQPSKYIKFILHKENIDTMKAIKIISQNTGIKDKSFGIAGNKDKKAITTQNVTVFANYLDKLKQVQLPNNIKIGNFQYTENELKIGDLYGNYFEIIIRNINSIERPKISELIENLKTKGFINYFGRQRFGNSIENSTHSIGLAILTKNYSAAVDLILGPRPVKNPQEQLARDNWIKHRDASISLTEFPSFCVIYYLGY